METEAHRWTERQSKDARLIERQRNENCNQGSNFKLKKIVISGVPQVIATIMFQIYVNNMQCGVTSYMNLFADDAKLMRVVERTDDC